MVQAILRIAEVTVEETIAMFIRWTKFYQTPNPPSTHRWTGSDISEFAKKNKKVQFIPPDSFLRRCCLKTAFGLGLGGLHDSCGPARKCHWPG